MPHCCSPLDLAAHSSTFCFVETPRLHQNNTPAECVPARCLWQLRQEPRVCGRRCLARDQAVDTDYRWAELSHAVCTAHDAATNTCGILRADDGDSTGTRRVSRAGKRAFNSTPTAALSRVCIAFRCCSFTVERLSKVGCLTPVRPQGAMYVMVGVDVERETLVLQTVLGFETPRRQAHWTLAWCCRDE